MARRSHYLRRLTVRNTAARSVPNRKYPGFCVYPAGLPRSTCGMDLVALYSLAIEVMAGLSLDTSTLRIRVSFYSVFKRRKACPNFGPMWPRQLPAHTRPNTVQILLTGAPLHPHSENGTQGQHGRNRGLPVAACLSSQSGGGPCLPKHQAAASDSLVLYAYLEVRYIMPTHFFSPRIWRASSGVATSLPYSRMTRAARSTNWTLLSASTPLAYMTLSSMPTRMWPPRATAP